MLPRRVLRLTLLALSLVGADCSDAAHWELLRRKSEGISGTPAGAALVESRIAALVDGMGAAIQEGGADASLADRMAFHDVPGVAVAVIHDGRIEWVAGFGTRGEDVPTALPPYALFQGASLSKVLTAIAALRAGENLGYTSVIVGSLERRDGVAIMTNGQRFFFGGGRVLAWEIIDAIAHIYDWGDWGGWGH